METSPGRGAAGERMTAEEFGIAAEACRKALVQLCRRYFQDVADAEDIVQESLVRAYEKLAYFDPTKGSPGGWIYRIAQRECLTLLRRRRLVVPLDSHPATDYLAAPSTADPNLEAVISREQRAEWTRVHSALDACLTALKNGKEKDAPEQYRAVLLRYLMNLPLEDVAREMAVPIARVKYLLFKSQHGYEYGALPALRRCLTRKLGGNTRQLVDQIFADAQTFFSGDGNPA